MRYFDRLHPISAFFYFLMMLLCAMLTMNPIIVSLCYIFGILFCGMLIGAKKLFLSLACTVPLMLVIALINPLFVHKGATVLFFLNSNPVTLESLVYGAVSSLMIMSVFYWCRAYGEIMTGDKFVYLFGRVSPRLSLILSMTMGFIPKFRRKFSEIDEAQRALGIYATDSFFDRIRAKMRTLSILLTSVLENSVDSADSMSARGYDLGGRTSYSRYRFTLADAAYLVFTLILGGTVVTLVVLGAADFDYYPLISRTDGSPMPYVLYGLLAAFAGASVFMEVKENIIWRYLRSKI